MLCCFSRVQFFVTQGTVGCQPPLSMEFSRQEYWSGLPCSPPGDLPEPGIEPTSLMLPTLAGGFSTTSATWKPSMNMGVQISFKDSNFKKCYIFMFILAAPQGLWDLSSLTIDQTRPPCTGSTDS